VFSFQMCLDSYTFFLTYRVAYHQLVSTFPVLMLTYIICVFYLHCIPTSRLSSSTPGQGPFSHTSSQELTSASHTSQPQQAWGFPP
jgi:hypothetical protein